MEAELKAYQEAIAEVGTAVAKMNAARKALHDAVEAAATTTGNNLAQDLSKQP